MQESHKDMSIDSMIAAATAAEPVISVIEFRTDISQAERDALMTTVVSRCVYNKVKPSIYFH